MICLLTAVRLTCVIFWIGLGQYFAIEVGRFVSWFADVCGSEWADFFGAVYCVGVVAFG